MLEAKQRLNLATAKWRFHHADGQVSAKFFKILFKKTSLENSRFGFLFSGKIGKAAARNLARRRLIEAVQVEKESFTKGDFIFIAYPNIIGVDYEELRLNLHQVLPKIPLL